MRREASLAPLLGPAWISRDAISVTVMNATQPRDPMPAPPRPPFSFVPFYE